MARSMEPGIERTRGELIGWVAATSISLLAATTVLMLTNDGLALSLERRLPPALVILELLAAVLLVASGWVAGRPRPHVSVALALTAVGILVPLWATWPSMPGWARAAVLAVGPLSVPGAAQVALRWHRTRGWPKPLRFTYLVAAAGGLIHVLAYNPFADPACIRTCVDIRPLAAGLLDTQSAVAATALLTIGAALVAAVAIFRAPPSHAPKVISVGVVATLVIFGTAWALRWALSRDPRQSDLVLLLPFVGGAAVSMALLGAAIQTWRSRLSIDRLVARLAGGEAGLKDLGGTVREVQFALPEGEGWVDTMGQRIPESERGDREILVSDRSGSVVRLLLAPGKESIDVVEVLTPATRLALKNAQLATANRTRMTEVQASQRRVVAASDAERRRIERDLHDGAQQRLISAAFQMKLVRTQLSTDPAPLSRAEELVGEALVHLRRLAHGVFPSVLTSEGLWVALDELVKASVVRTTLEITGRDDNIYSETAMAAYATAVATLEEAARQNVGGHARVSVRREKGLLEVSVDISSTADFPSLPDFVDLGDRVGAVGGTLSGRSVDGVTTVTVVLPCG